jgi:hypothetical protein
METSLARRLLTVVERVMTEGAGRLRKEETRKWKNVKVSTADAIAEIDVS